MLNEKKIKRFDDSFFNKLRFILGHFISDFLLFFKLKYFLLLRNQLCKWIIPQPKEPIICPHFGDIELLVDPIFGKGLEEAIYYFGRYEAGTLFVIKQFLKEGDIFFDVGANIGSISCAVSQFVGESGQIYAFEPHPETYNILKYNISINNLKNVFAFDFGLGSEISTAKIYNKPNMGRGAASLLQNKDSIEESINEVKIVTIDSLIEEKKLPIPTFMKIDVEGFELEVLRGAKNLLSSSYAPMLCIEYSTYLPQYKGKTLDIFNFIISINDYTCFKLKRSKEIPSKLIEIKNSGELPLHDNIFCFRNFHLK